MRNKILDLQKYEKVIEKELMVEKVKVRKFQEKLSQEREWYKKEQNTTDKKGEEFHKLKSELGEVQENFSKEHTVNIRLQRELKELNQQNDNFRDRCREIDGENIQLKTAGTNYRKEISQLKREVAQLSKKKEDTQWIAKSEYERVTQLLKKKEKELQQVERELER